MRQWVLSLPFALRVRVAFEHDLALAIARIAVGAIEARYRRLARAAGLREPRGGAVVVLQRFGSDLRLNLHLQRSRVLTDLACSRSREIRMLRLNVHPRWTTLWIRPADRREPSMTAHRNLSPLGLALAALALGCDPPPPAHSRTVEAGRGRALVSGGQLP